MLIFTDETDGKTYGFIKNKKDSRCINDTLWQSNQDLDLQPAAQKITKSVNLKISNC